MPPKMIFRLFLYLYVVTVLLDKLSNSRNLSQWKRNQFTMLSHYISSLGEIFSDALSYFIFLNFKVFT